VKRKLLLLETEMRGPGGHYLDNLIETFFFFKNDFDIYALLNHKFDDKGTFIPSNLIIHKILKRNNFEKKDNKFFYYLFEILSFLNRFFLALLFIPYFLLKKNMFNYFNALISNNFILPRYFLEIYFFLLKNNFTENDHIFFQTTRNKHMSLANFLIRINTNIPKIHLRILYTPVERKFGGFFYYLNKIKLFLLNKKIYLYVLTNKNYNILRNKLKSKDGIFLSNIPWVFYNRTNDNNYKTVGYLGDARVNRGFNYLPKIISELSKLSKDFKFIIQYSKVSKEVKETSDKLLNMSKTNSNINIYIKYMDYKEFRDTLQKIDIMPILHNSEEINLGNPSTIYSSITHQIPMTLPSNLKYMRNVLIHKSYEDADNLDDTIKKIVLIKNNYESYLLSAKKNSSILFKIFNDDPLKKNIN
tara:strand:- start:69 stop:1316 length:1248 start_codon:yes stop_codon:yes gene_type:complete